MEKKRITALRERLGLNKAAFAKKLGVDKSTITKWEKGRREPGKFAMRELERMEKRAS